MSARSTLHRFRPRFIAVALVSLSLGVILISAAVTITPDRFSSVFALISGVAGLFLSSIYLRSPVWKLAVEVQDRDLIVWNGEKERLRLPWTDVRRVVVDPDHKLCFVDGGCPEKSLLVPGPGAQTSYTISHRAELIAAILGRVSEDLIQSSATQDLNLDPGPAAAREK